MIDEKTSFYLNTTLLWWQFTLFVLFVVFVYCFVFKIPQTVPVFLRRSLNMVRCLTTIFLFVVFLKPSIEKEKIIIKKEKTHVLIDISESMGIKDVVVGEETKTRINTARSLFGEITQTTPGGVDIVPVGFGKTTTEIPQDTNRWPVLEGETRIEPALKRVLKTTIGVPLQDVIIISDGNFNDGVSSKTLDSFVSRGVSIQTIPIGSKNTQTNIRVGGLDLPESVYIGDKTPFNQQFFSNKPIPKITIKIKDVETGDIVWKSFLTPQPLGGEAFSVSGSFSINKVGSRRLSFVFDDPPGFRFLNSKQTTVLDVVDKPIKTLYVEGYPRWFYRFFVGDMIREKSIELSSFLVSADMDFIQDGNESITRLPNTKEELELYDLIILGDVSPNTVGEDFLTLVKQRVVSGGSLCWIPGFKNKPSTWSQTPLKNLWPTQPNKTNTHTTPIQIKPTMSAKRLGVMGLEDDGASWPQELGDPKVEWSKLWNTVVFPNKNLRPGCDVLATATGGLQENVGPVVVFMPYGSGSVLTVGTSETWRWRYGVGSKWGERFWISLFRMLYRGTKDLNRWFLKTTPQKITMGDSVFVEVTQPSQEDFGDFLITITNTDSGSVDYINFKNKKNTFWKPTQPGSFLFEIDGKPGVEKQLVVVTPRVNEMSAKTKKEDVLSFISKKTKGSVFSKNNFLEWWSKKKTKQQKVIEISTHEVWRSWFVYCFLVFCMFLDWLIRRKGDLI